MRYGVLFLILGVALILQAALLGGPYWLHLWPSLSCCLITFHWISYHEYPQKDIWCFTGYTFDNDILNKMCNEWDETNEILSYIDVLVDGKFVEELKDLNLRFKGSSNQRTILVKESLVSGEIILWDSSVL